MSSHSNDRPDYVSPPCFAIETEPELGARAAQPGSDDVARWRKDERRRLIAERLTVSAGERRRIATVVMERLVRLMSEIDATTVSLYWPFRGELNLFAPGCTPFMSREFVSFCRLSRRRENR